MAGRVGDHKNLKPDARMIIFLDPSKPFDVDDPDTYEVGASGINSDGDQAIVEEVSTGPHPASSVRHTQHIRVKYKPNPCVWIGSKRVCW